MSAQDLIFTAGSLVFIVALLPMVFGPAKPAVSSAVSTGTVLAVFAATYLTLGLIFAAATTAITAVLWLTLAWQSWRVA